MKATDCYGDTTGTMEAIVTLGTAPFNYVWSTTPLQTNSKATGLRAGVYTVVITDSKMCSVAYTDTIKEAASTKIFMTKKDVDCLTDLNGSARVDSVMKNDTIANINNYTYLWNTIPVQTTRGGCKIVLWLPPAYTE